MIVDSRYCIGYWICLMMIRIRVLMFDDDDNYWKLDIGYIGYIGYWILDIGYV